MVPLTIYSAKTRPFQPDIVEEVIHGGVFLYLFGESGYNTIGFEDIDEKSRFPAAQIHSLQ